MLSEQKNEISVSIIIAHYNSISHLENSIKSIIKHTDDPNYEIIVIDIAPIKDYKDNILKLSCGIRYFLSNANIGYGKANNIGIEESTGKYLLILNPDTLFIEDSIKKCFAFMEKNKTCGILGCKQLNEDGKYTPSFFPFLHTTPLRYLINSNPILYRLFNVKEKYKEPRHIKTVGDVAGSYLFIRKEIFLETNKFDPDFFLYFEESELCRRKYKEKKWHVIYTPETSIIHIGSGSGVNDKTLLQNFVSEGLFWYKQGIINYLIFIVFFTFNSFFATSAFSIKIEALMFFIFHIPKYKNTWGARHEHLRVM